MRKTVIDRQRFIEKCNAELRKDPYYESGLMFVPSPVAEFDSEFDARFDARFDAGHYLDDTPSESNLKYFSEYIAGFMSTNPKGYIKGRNGIDCVGPEDKIGVFTRAIFRVNSEYQIRA